MSGSIPLGLLLAHHAARDPHRPAVTANGLTVTRADLEARANRRARWLAAAGVGEADFVAIVLPNGLEFYETVFAIWKLGATPAPVSSQLPAGELHEIVGLLRPRAVVGLEVGSLPGTTCLPGGQDMDGGWSAEPLPPAVAPSWKAMASGGSTGRPKVIVSARPSTFDPATRPLRMNLDDVVLNSGPMYHNAPFSLVFQNLFLGGHAVDMGRFDAEQALALIAQHGVTWVNFVPTMMHRIWRLEPRVREQYDLSSLRTVFHMASSCPVWLKESWIGWLGPHRIWELYGGTEDVGGTVIDGAEWLRRKGSVGRVQPGATVHILDEEGRELPAGTVGEIYFRPADGPDGRYRYLGADAKREIDGAQSLGDLGYLDEDGYLFLADRRTDLIISGGANIYPAEVEAALDAHPAIRSSAVIGLPDEDLGQTVHAIVESDDAGLTLAGLAPFLSERLVRYKIPRSLEVVRTPLRDDAGKVRRAALREARSGPVN